MKKRIVTVSLLVVMILSSFTTTAMAFSPELVGKEPGGLGQPAYQRYVMSSSALTNNTDAVRVRTSTSLGKFNPSGISSFLSKFIPTFREFLEVLKEVVSLSLKQDTFKDKLKCFAQKGVPVFYEYYVRITDLWKEFMAG